MHIVTVAALAYLLDLLIGDPHFLWHPVCGIGRLIGALRSVAKKAGKKNKTRELVLGALIVLVTLSVSTGIAAALIAIAGAFSKAAKIAVEVVIAYQMLAVKSLKTESMKVYDALEKGDIMEGRKAVSMIVGRDTASLSEEGIIKAAVETVAENSSDGVIAPLFYLFVFGVPGMVCYKAVNTLDSMIGYKNEEYLYLGRVAAKADDAANFIPSRLSALFLILASFALGYDGREAARIFARDRYNHASPNSAQTEAAMAGALNVQLAGDAYYFGTLYKKKTIGDKIHAISTKAIRDANRILYGMSLLAVIIMGSATILLERIL